VLAIVVLVLAIVVLVLAIVVHGGFPS